jgi:regulator of sirC expression with transglutaminase-like and TPR domain
VTGDLYAAFRRAVDCPEEDIDLGKAALAIAKGEYPNLSIDDCLSRLDQLGRAVDLRLGDEKTPFRIIAAVNMVLFKEQGYEGNRDNYYDPKNSFLNDVIERKTGIPITLSVLYMEVARRVGLALHGVGFPGHFLVKYDDGSDVIVIDPFNQGEILTREDLDRLLKDLYGSNLAYDPQFLEPITKTEILRRLLNNLKIIYLRTNEPLKALAVLEHLVILDPTSAPDIRDRGLMYEKLECFVQAVEDLENYLRLAPGADDVATIEYQLADLRQRAISIH